MVSAVVLAAGRARRMGTQKLLLPWGDGTVIGQVVREIGRCEVDPVLVVVGADAVAIARALAGQRVGFVTNPEPDGDMLGSVRCGLRNLPAGCRAVLLVLGDQPVISAALVTRLLSVYGTCGRGIVVPACGGRPGHPLLFSTRYCAEILAGYETTGLRGLLEIHRDDVFALEVSDPAVLTDLDTPADYCRALRATATRRGASGP